MKRIKVLSCLVRGSWIVEKKGLRIAVFDFSVPYANIIRKSRGRADFRRAWVMFNYVNLPSVWSKVRILWIFSLPMRD
ncbi:MAG: hypothetical protein AAGU16_03120 [Desulfitobacterium hafniense]